MHRIRKHVSKDATYLFTVYLNYVEATHKNEYEGYVICSGFRGMLCHETNGPNSNKFTLVLDGIPFLYKGEEVIATTPNLQFPRRPLRVSSA